MTVDDRMLCGIDTWLGSTPSTVRKYWTAIHQNTYEKD